LDIIEKMGKRGATSGMVLTKKTVYKILGGVFCFTLLFWSIVTWYSGRVVARDIEQINTHAKIIALGVWNLDKDGTTSYLQLVLKAEDYKEIEIISDQNEVFLQVTSPPLKGLDEFLEKYGLIWTKEMSTKILFQNNQLGVLQGKKNVLIIYQLVNIFVFQFFIVLTGIFIVYLFHNRKMLEKEVEERTRRYHELVNLLPEMVLETDEKGKIIYANKIALSRFGVERLKSTAYFVFDFINLQGDGSSKDFWHSVLSLNNEQSEYVARSHDGTDFPVLIRSAPIYKDNLIVGARMVIVDITERSAMEDKLRQDQKMKSIGIMAGGVAHDLNNILSGVVNYPELMLMHLPRESDLIKYVEPMKEAGLRAAAIVADLLTVARGIAATRTVTDINGLVVDYLNSPEFQQFVSAHSELRYTTQLNPEPCLISCSLIHVRKCLMNLCSNAVESMEGKGQIIISTKKLVVDALQAKEIKVEVGNYVAISVCDQGKGVCENDLSHIFEPFYTKKEMGRSGTGLGLTVVWNTMQDHKGSVQVDTDETETIFTLYFPIDENSDQIPVETFSDENILGEGESILVIDDEPQQRDIASRLLISLGYKVSIAATGQEAIESVRKHPINLLLLDMVISPGLTGLETYKQILKLYPKQKAIIASGFSASDDVKETLALGAGGLINKPYTKDQLARAVYLELQKKLQ